MSLALQNMGTFRLAVEAISEFAPAKVCDLALRELGVERSALDVERVFIPYSLQAIFIENVARRIGVRHLGAIVAGRYPYGELGPYARYVLAAPDLEAAIRRGVRALPYLQPGSSVTIRQDGNLVLLGFSTGVDTVVGARQIEEGMPLILLQLARSFLGSAWRPERIYVPGGEGGREANLADIFEGIEIRFGASVPAIAIPTGDLKARNPDPTSNRHPAILSDVRTMLRSPPPRSDAELVGNILQFQIQCGDPSEDGVAQRLGLGRRTLQRRLQAEGTSFRELQQQALRVRAKALLGEGDLSVAEVARALGFREVNSFRRAFRGWFGVTPTKYASVHRRNDAIPSVTTDRQAQSHGTT